jgi:hypothetical protein
MAKALAVRSQPFAAEEAEDQVSAADAAAQTFSETCLDSESSARLILPPVPVVPKIPPLRPQPALVPSRVGIQREATVQMPEEPPRYASRDWRAEAWDRKRERTWRAVERRPGILARRCSDS